MKKISKKFIYINLFIVLLFVCFAFSASAAKEGCYTYSVSNGEATITKVDTFIEGDVTIPSTIGGYSVTEIGEYAFYGCTKFKSITIPNSVKTIKDFAFYGCTGLVNITIPDSVICTGGLAFYNTGYYNNESNWENNVLYIGNHLIKAKKDISGSYTIKEGTRYIPGDAFAYCADLTSVTIPDSVIHIGYCSFDSCTGLKNVTIPDSVTSIGYEAFYNCKSLTSIIIGKGVTEIGYNAFDGCTELVNITITDSVTYIGDEAFCNTGYYNATTNWENKVLYIGNHLIKAKKDISGFYAIRDGTKTVSTSAFEECSDLASITIPNSVKIIDCLAFYGCIGLKSITIPNSVTEIGYSAFERCSGLTSITIPDGVTSIKKSAFFGCTGLKNIFYSGTQAQWENIEIELYNTGLENAIIHYNGCNGVFSSTLIEPSCTNKGKIIYTCSCGNSYTESIEKLSHTYKATTTKATLTKNGKIENKCSCGDVKTTTIYYPKTIKLSLSKVTYNGKAYSPSITVKDSKGNTLKKDTDYTVTTPSGRKAPGKYTYTIKFKGNYSGTKTLTLTILPTKTSKLTATPKSNEIKLTWKAVEGATGYKVYQYDYTKKKSTALTTLTGTSYTIKKLKANTKYRFSVKAYKTVNGEKLWSDVYTIVETKTCPAVVKELSATQTTTSIKLTWSAVSGAKGYKVYRYVDNKWKEIKNTTSTSYTVSKLKEGSKYKFAVKAYVKNGEKLVYSSSYKTLETATKCKAPTLTSVTSPSKSKATVKWTDVGGETGFQLYCATSKDGTYKKLSTFKGNVTSGTSTLPSAVRGKTVYFKVRAYKTVGDKTVYSAWSNIKSVKIK